MLAIGPTKELIETYEILQLRKKKGKDKLKWITCKIVKSDIVVDKLMTQGDLRAFMDDKKMEDVDEACHTVFVEALVNADGHRYGMMDYKDRVFFVSYIADAGDNKTKMVYATAREAFKGQLTGINHAMQCTEPGDLVKADFDKKVPNN